jgi:hypothetical protein
MSLFDAGFSSTVVLQHRKPIDLGANNRSQNREVGIALANALQSGDIAVVESLTGSFNQTGLGAKSGATLVFATSSGDVGATINGVNVEAASGAGTDIEDAALAATTINASVDAIVQGFVRASSSAASVTLSTMTAGSYIAIRVGRTTYVFTATAAATGVPGQFSIAGNDTVDAAAFCTAVNAFPGLNQSVRAESVAGVAYIYAMDGVITDKTVQVAGSGIALTAAFAAVARCHVECIIPGALGNAVTFAARGTNVSVANSSTRLVGGVGLVGTVKRANLGGAQ